MECVRVAGGEQRQLWVPIMGGFLYNEYQPLMDLVAVKIRRRRPMEDDDLGDLDSKKLNGQGTWAGGLHGLKKQRLFLIGRST